MKAVKNQNTLANFAAVNIQVFRAYVLILAPKVQQKNTSLQCDLFFNTLNMKE
jgi:hypothetical protein